MGRTSSDSIIAELGIVSTISTTVAHPTIALIKEVNIYWNVIDAKILDYLQFQVTFADGLSGCVRMLPSHLRGVFEKLKEPSVFNQLHVTDGFVSWPGDLDLAPDAMYDEIKKKW